MTIRKRLAGVAAIGFLLGGCNDTVELTALEETTKIEVENPDELLVSYTKIGDFLLETTNLTQDSQSLKEYNPTTTEMAYRDLLTAVERHHALLDFTTDLPEYLESVRQLGLKEIYRELDTGSEAYKEYRSNWNDLVLKYTKRMPDVVEDYYTQKGQEQKYQLHKEYRKKMPYTIEEEVRTELTRVLDNQNTQHTIKDATEKLVMTYKRNPSVQGIEWYDTLYLTLKKQGVEYLEVVTAVLTAHGNYLADQELRYGALDKVSLQKLEQYGSID